jgi:hypothetical protein
MSETQNSRKLRHGPWTVDEAMESLLAASKMFNYRNRAKPHQINRIRDALYLAEETNLPEKTSGSRKNYWEFLRNIESCGKCIVSLCAVGLGQSVIGRMRDSVRFDLATKIRERISDLKCSSLEDICEKFPPVPVLDNQSLAPVNNHMIISTNQQASLVGDIYELTLQDARAIVLSDQVRGQIWLTDSYDPNTISFISIPISDELKTQYIIQHSMVMLQQM